MGTYENPARIFLENHTVESLADVIAYTDFLRIESNLSCEPPINLQTIVSRFGMPSPKALWLPRQQGTIVPSYGTPQIIIHAGDIASRQNYSTAHELIELLFLELPGAKRYDGKKENIFGILGKEAVCQHGAANLLMPAESFQPRAERMGLSFQSGELLADEYKVSLMAALCRLSDMYPKKSVVILWTMANKPTELEHEVPEGQLEMPGFGRTKLPAPKLRVAWSYGNFKDIFIPKHKSIPIDSSVYKAWENDQFETGNEILPFGRFSRKGCFESKPITIEAEECVLSLLKSIK